MPEIQTGADAQENLDWYDRIGDRVRVFVRGWRRFDAWTLQPLSLDRARGSQPGPCRVSMVHSGPRRASRLRGDGEGATVLHADGHTRAFRPRPRPPSPPPCLGHALALAAGAAACRLPRHPAPARRPPCRRRGSLPYLHLRPGRTPLRLHVGPAITLALAFMLWPASWMAGRMVQRVPNEVMPSALPWSSSFHRRPATTSRATRPGSP